LPRQGADRGRAEQRARGSAPWTDRRLRPAPGRSLRIDWRVNDPDESGRLRVEGDGAKLGELLALLDEPDPGFAIVTPD
jgi:hypothetical protein